MPGSLGVAALGRLRNPYLWGGTRLVMSLQLTAVIDHACCGAGDRSGVCGVCCAWHGRHPVTVVPWPGADLTSMVPPRAPSRSAMFRSPEPAGTWLAS
jgi:hypothetical protein